MLIAIHNSRRGFHPRWIEYCKKKKIPFKLVNCYANDIVKRLEGCSGLMWHFSQHSSADIIMARQLLFALQQSGLKVFPNFNTSWHFDDKLGQKYLLESLGLPFVDTYVFFDKKEAMEWTETASFPKVFKLRGGAGSSNVMLVGSRKAAKRIINKAFGKGFRQYDRIESLRERWRKYRDGMTDWRDVVKGIFRLMVEPEFSKTIGYQRGYVYFQDYISDNPFDIRVVVIANKAFAIKRMVRKGDFRASGSGYIRYERENFPLDLIGLSFDMNDKVRAQSLALDFVFDNGTAKVVEISYGFVPSVYDMCTGYWDRDLVWHGGRFDPYGWMVDALIEEIGAG